MSKAIITEQHLHDIADAIIAKGGATAPMTPAQMPAAIQAIPSGVTVEPLTVTDAGTYTAPDGKAYSPVNVNIDNIWPQPWKNDGKTHLWYYFSKYDYAVAYLTAKYISDGHTFEVDWGDGTVETVAASSTSTTRALSHVYSSPGYKEVSIGGYDEISFSNSSLFGTTAEGFSNANKCIRQLELGGNANSILSIQIQGSGLRYLNFANKINSATLTSTMVGNSNLVAVHGLSRIVKLPYQFMRNCKSLVAVTDLEDVTSIDSGAFNLCEKLKSVGDLSSLTELTGSTPAPFPGSIQDLYFSRKTHTDVMAITGFTRFPDLGIQCVFHCSDGDFYRYGSNLLPLD